MSPEDRNAIKAKIQQLLDKLENDIESLKELTKPIPPENAVGRLSRMDAINNKSVNEAALRQAKVRKEKLLRAQTRVEQENFGICRKCQNPIPVGRLLLIPESTRCVACA